MGVGKNIDHLGAFTMSKHFERKGNCFAIYRKSLLYLVHHALEPEEDEPIPSSTTMRRLWAASPVECWTSRMQKFDLNLRSVNCCS